jgi:hypothetical protein
MQNLDRRRAQSTDVRVFVGEVFGADLHAKRIDSLADAALGVMLSASLAVAMIGQALALAKGLVTKQATLALHLVTGHARAAPLLRLSVWKDELKDRRNDLESLPSGLTRGMRACGGWPNSCPTAAASPSLRIAAEPALGQPAGLTRGATRNCSPFWRNWALAT